jgi:branched-chain amino acid transport system permease protein
VLGEVLAWPLVLLIAAALGADRGGHCRALDAAPERRLLRHLHVRLTRVDPPARGLVRGQQVARARRYVFVDITQADIYWQLLALTAAVFLLGWLIARSRSALRCG